VLELGGEEKVEFQEEVNKTERAKAGRQQMSKRGKH